MEHLKLTIEGMTCEHCVRAVRGRLEHTEGVKVSDVDVGLLPPIHTSISANLGVNPSLSITAQAERAASLWPNKGQVDERPAQGGPYRRLAPIPPEHPVVPADAPAALRRLPIEPVSSAG